MTRSEIEQEIKSQNLSPAEIEEQIKALRRKRLALQGQAGSANEIAEIEHRIDILRTLLECNGQSESLVVTFRNLPSKKALKLLFESYLKVDEGQTKSWGNGYTYRLDKRDDSMGGNQLHISGPKGKKWAYRYNGSRSERSKYTSSATNIVKDIVSSVFNIDKLNIEETWIRSADNQTMLIEIIFT